jgi:hypothetical protein
VQHAFTESKQKFKEEIYCRKLGMFKSNMFNYDAKKSVSRPPNIRRPIGPLERPEPDVHAALKRVKERQRLEQEKLDAM